MEKFSTDTSRYQNGLVLGGGGAKGAYQIGVFRALLDNDIKVDAVSGSSIGALNATLILTGEGVKASEFWLSLSTFQMVKISPLFLLSFILNSIHAVLGRLLYRPPYSDPPTPAILNRSARLTQPLLAVLGLVVTIVAFGPFHGDWILTSLLILVIAGPLYGFLADFLNVSIVSQRPLQQILDGIDWTKVISSQTPIHVTIARWAYSYSDPRIAWLARLPENPQDAELYEPNFVKLVERTRWLAKSRRELAPFYPVLNGESEEQAKALVLASMAFPGGVFRHVEIGKVRYMDGGASDNTPIYPLLIYDCENLFVAHLRPVPWERGFRIRHANSLRYWLWEINLLMERIGEPIYPEFLFRRLPRIIHIAPEKNLGFGLLSTFYFSKKKSRRLIDQGYRDTIKVLTAEGLIPQKT